ncbi:hypothetical protein CPAV1605_671 [seawater metagenome]|uniref:Endonuclease/exonuclease/phosphatase domain-containing protein n=1 Tax=seawater metagenome TaxID=1561972 RepID=A0A5E8CIN6_9ZZZZ
MVEIKIITYNIKRLFVSNDKYFLPNELSNYDIILLQECWNHNRKEKILEEFSRLHKYNIIYEVNKSFYQLLDNGLVILSKYKILENDFIPFKLGFFECIKNFTPLEVLGNKGILYVKLEIENQDYYIFNTHFIANYTEIQQNKISSLEDKLFIEIFDVIKDKTNYPDQKVILGGDFNNLPFFVNNYCKDDFNIYEPIEPTIFTKWIVPMLYDESHSRIPEEENSNQYKGYVLDYFITKNVKMNNIKAVELIPQYSDHKAVSASFKVKINDIN